MIRTIVAIVVLFAAILWLPVGVQIGLFAIGIIMVPYRWALLLPAVSADALYAPVSHLRIGNFKMTLLVGVGIFLYWLITTYTRIGTLYAIWKK